MTTIVQVLIAVSAAAVITALIVWFHVEQPKMAAAARTEPPRAILASLPPQDGSYVTRGPGRHADDTDRLDDAYADQLADIADDDTASLLPVGMVAAAARAQHQDDAAARALAYAELSPDALEPCGECGRVGPHDFTQWAAEQADWKGRQVAHAAVFAGMNGLETAWCGDYGLDDAA